MALYGAFLCPFMRPNARAGVSTGCNSVSSPSHSAKAHDETGVRMPKNKIAKLRDVAFTLQDGRCWYCGFPMVKSAGANGHMHRFTCTAEYLVPKSEGGADASCNIKAVCLFCNRTRHRMALVLCPTAYRKYVRSRLDKGRWHPMAHSHAAQSEGLVNR